MCEVRWLKVILRLILAGLTKKRFARIIYNKEEGREILINFVKKGIEMMWV